MIQAAKIQGDRSDGAGHVAGDQKDAPPGTIMSADDAGGGDQRAEDRPPRMR